MPSTVSPVIPHHHSSASSHISVSVTTTPSPAPYVAEAVLPNLATGASLACPRFNQGQDWTSQPAALPGSRRTYRKRSPTSFNKARHAAFLRLSTLGSWVSRDTGRRAQGAELSRDSSFRSQKRYQASEEVTAVGAMGRDSKRAGNAPSSQKPPHARPRAEAVRGAGQDIRDKGTGQVFHAYNRSGEYQDSALDQLQGLRSGTEDRHSWTAAWLGDLHDGWSSMGAFSGEFPSPFPPIFSRIGCLVDGRRRRSDRDHMPPVIHLSCTPHHYLASSARVGIGPLAPKKSGPNITRKSAGV